MEKNPFIVPPGRKVRLDDYDPAHTGDFTDEAAAQAKIQRDAESLARYQDKLLAQESHALLLLFQAMDGSGKDGTIKHVLSSADPQGCRAYNFQKPAGEEIRHDYLWRFVQKLPERGQIGIFNRTYYEEVLSSRVHPEQLEEQGLPPAIRQAKNLWGQRYDQINHFEQYLVENGIVVVKFFLHISKEKQRERLLERLDLPEKQWKFSMDDIEDRGHWDEYMRAYEEMLGATSTRRAPWYVIPADHRWFSALAVAEIVVARLRALKLRYPPLKDADRKEREEARKLLEGEKPGG